MRNMISRRLVRAAMTTVTLTALGSSMACVPVHAQPHLDSPPWESYTAEVIDTEALSVLPIAWCPTERPACELAGQRVVSWFQLRGAAVTWELLDEALYHAYEPSVTVTYRCAPDPTDRTGGRIMILATGVRVRYQHGMSGEGTGEAFIPDGGTVCQLV